MRPTTRKIAEARRKKEKNTCPECGKDVHDPDCPYYGTGSS
jgi:hypothetical protein